MVVYKIISDILFKTYFEERDKHKEEGE